jgi:hypothetical protein
LNKRREKFALEITYSLEGSEHSVSDNLSASRSSKETDSLVLSSLRAEDSLVNILENFVETKLCEALSGVAQEGSVPSLKIFRGTSNIQ